MKKLYLVTYRYRQNTFNETGKMAFEADNVQKALAQFLAPPSDEDEAKDWADTLKRMESLTIEFFCHK
jgi:hypothetical protein